MLSDDHVYVLAFKGLAGRGLLNLDLGQPWTGRSCIFHVPRSVQSEVRNGVSSQVRETVQEARKAVRP